MKTIDRTMGLSEWALLLGLSILWGGSFFFVGVAVEELGPLTIVALRTALAAVALNLVILVRGQRMPRDPGLWAAFFAMGLLNNMIPYSLIAWGQGHIASGLASILNATTPLFTLVVAHFFTRDEPLTPGRLLGIAIGFGGVVYMLGSEADEVTVGGSWAPLAVLAGRPLLCLSRGFRAPLSLPGLPAPDGRLWTGHGIGAGTASPGPERGAFLAIAPAGPGYLVGDVRPGAVLDRSGVPDLFPLA